METRELVASGADHLVGLFAAVLPESPTVQVDQLDEPEAFLRDPSSFVLGAYIDDSPVGLAWGLQMRSSSGRLTTYVHELDVRENWRRLGVDSALIAEALTLARRRGSTKLWLSTGGHNEAAQALYESLGGERCPVGLVTDEGPEEVEQDNPSHPISLPYRGRTGCTARVSHPGDSAVEGNLGLPRGFRRVGLTR